MADDSRDATHSPGPSPLHASGSSSYPSSDPTRPSTGSGENQKERSSSHVSGQIRSRLTVVCAECKRLKLKCDRRTPCSQCQKRECIPRCIYTQGAMEKVDVQSLHNRVLTIEAKLDMLTPAQLQQLAPASLPATTLATVGGGYPPFPSASSHFSTPAPPSSTFATPPTAVHPPHPHPASAHACLCPQHPPFVNDRTILATGPSGSSLSISVDDIAGIWLRDLGIDPSSAEAFEPSPSSS
ncbi:hypothetical protein PUNSTDRAFT_81062, partial [Punctularia strigosozonata HHB-11173 SS5]|uniref:uncharacterized protein n=1 Tax=Punctularia strigosozonata (strain HHB-11173) TaxID=741275 RepID=UPI0004417C66